MGRIEHGKTGDQTGADMEIVNAALERMELVYIEAEPGDALFFHCNLLHRSDQNRSPRSALVADLLLQRGPQQSLQGIAPSALLAAGESLGLGDQTVEAAAAGPR